MEETNMNGKMDALKKLGSYVDGMEPAEKKEDEGIDEELKKGIEVEMEHTEDPEEAKKIAMDRIEEDPEYYSKLEGMEEGETPEEAMPEAEGGEEVGPAISISMLARKPKAKGFKKRGK